MPGPPGSPRDLDGALDELYAVRPDQFVQIRKALSTDLRIAGDAGSAKQLERARRPTVAAWALNKLTRVRPELVEELLERGRELRAAQVHARSGRADELRHAMAARRAALSAAADTAVTLAGQVTTNAEIHRDAIAGTLEAASVDERLGASLHAGRLVRTDSGPIGFPETAPLRLVESRPTVPDRRARRSAGDEPPAPEGDEQNERRAPERADAEARLDELARQARHAEQQASERALAAAAADDRIQKLRAEIDDARARFRAAQQEAGQVRRDAQASRKAADSMRRSVEAARRRLRERRR